VHGLFDQGAPGITRAPLLLYRTLVLGCRHAGFGTWRAPGDKTGVRLAGFHGKRLGREAMFEQAFRNVDDILRKEAGCTTELDYTEQTSWLLFLKYLDGLEQDKATEAALEGTVSVGELGCPQRQRRRARS
jgi:HsdM N-terminal domain